MDAFLTPLILTQRNTPQSVLLSHKKMLNRQDHGNEVKCTCYTGSERRRKHFHTIASRNAGPTEQTIAIMVV